MLCFHSHSIDAMEDSHDDNANNNSLNEKASSCGDYDNDLYAFYRFEECHNTIKGYKVDADMRRNMVDWLIDTHYGLGFMPETLYLCVNILDRFFSKTKFKAATKKEFELVGLTFLLLASKYEEESPLCVYDLEYITQFSCSIKEICDMEIAILQKLDWVLTVPTPYVFLVRNMGVSLLSDDDKIMENMVFFLSELSLTHYPIAGCYKPSLIAASAVYGARIIVGRLPFWNKTLKRYTGYSKKKLRCCTKLMLDLCSAACRDGHMEVFRKFSSPDHCKVAYVAQQEFSSHLKNRSDLRIRLNMSRDQHHLFNLNICQKNIRLMYLCGC